ncbi:hypothetical protein ACIQVT_27485 [Streptomyces sp. NPDC100445]|uniref:hypothetical protein n=1 Tax=Streptomyces sp. NPDC100445 TaxID=3366102 RepID=UPI0038021E74
MPDRSLRLLTFPPRPVQGGVRGAALLRDRPTPPPTGAPRDGSDQDAPAPGASGPGGSGSAGSGQGGPGRGGSGSGGSGSGGGSGRDDSGSGSGSGSGSEQDGGRQDGNPFAPPPEGAPDRPWQPRHPVNPSGHGHGQGHGDGQSQGHGPGPGQGPGWGPGQPPGPGNGSGPGGRWSDRQPGRAPGNFGERPGAPQGPGPGGPPTGPGMRWDPSDPAQRRARYALLSGMWAVFFVLFSWPYVALLLGALALYWGSSALRADNRRPAPGTPDAPTAPTTPAAPNGRPQRTAAISGLVTASLALVLVASTFTVQLVYRDYYTCVGDALTHEAKQSCETLLPHQLRGVLGTENS